MLASASFVLLTAESEGFPLVLMEAMAAGCIPIAYDIKYGPADMIHNRKNGFLVPPGDVEALGRAVQHFLLLSPAPSKDYDEPLDEPPAAIPMPL